MAYQIDNPEDIEARIYVQASYANSFRSGWGVVIDRQGHTLELSAGTDGETEPRLLLIGCIEALRVLAPSLPVRVLCSVEYLTRWTLPRLPEMRANGFKVVGKRKLPNADLVQELGKLTQRHPYVAADTIGKAKWDEHHWRAEALARQHGAGETDQAIRPMSYLQPKPQLVTQVHELRPHQAQAQVQSKVALDLPWD